jgi:hypothetical protein
MYLNILSRSFRLGTLGFLGTETFADKQVARFIFRPAYYEPNVHIFMFQHYDQVMVITGGNVKEAQGVACVLFSIRLIGPLRNARHLQYSVMRELQGVKGTDGFDPKKEGYLWADNTAATQ